MGETRDDNRPDYHLIAVHEPRKGKRRATREFLSRVEEHATALRRRAGVEPLSKLDPGSLVSEFNLVVPDMDELVALSPDDRDHLSAVDAKVWSGGGIPLSDGRLLILLNPHQTAERAAVTLMEEVVHEYLNHRPSQIVNLPNGVTKREYDPDIEWEAYSVAAAAMLPRLVVARAVWSQRSVDSLAAEYGVSTELVEMRMKLLLLWSDHMRGTQKVRRVG